MAELTGGEVVGKILREEGVSQYFGIQGGHLWTLLNGVRAAGVRMMHFRHEQAGVYAADGWARTTRRPGVCFGTAGPGMFNMVPGIAHAYLAESPVVALVGQHPTVQDDWGPFQEGHAPSVFGSITKWTRRVYDSRLLGFYLRQAFRDVMTYPPRPIVIELPVNVLDERRDENEQRGLVPKAGCPQPGRALGDPDLVEQAVRMLLEADRPAIVVGGGIFWANAAEELREFIELTQIPMLARRMGRGAVPENHPLAFTGGIRKAVLSSADVVAVIGLRLNILEGFGTPPIYKHEAKYIQISEAVEELCTRLPTQLSIIANPKLVIRQMIDCAKALLKSPPRRAAWLETVSKIKDASDSETQEALAKVSAVRPIDPNFLCQEIADFLDPNATIIFDSFSGAGIMTDKFRARFAGQVLDTATGGGVGHGIGMGIGAQLGRPGKQVLVLIGDGGMGVGGMDIETAARYELPICYVVYNNDSWMSPSVQKMVCPHVESWAMLPGIRYDKMFAETRCYGETVTEPEQIRPALERAFNSQKTSLINVMVDHTVLPPLQWLITARVKAGAEAARTALY